MDYIVFDLEWNQSPNGKQYSNQRLPFEIIELGAVKLNENLEIVDSFHRLIRPQVYRWIHNTIHDVTHMDMKELRKGTIFPVAAREFLHWCGSSCRFCTWGDQDVMELQRNMNYYGILRLIPGPVVFLNVQKLFSICFETPDVRRSLEYAADYLRIETLEDFHRALNDAHFTAQILTRIDKPLLERCPSLDVYQHPDSKQNEVTLHFPTSSKYVSREFVSREKAMKDKEVPSTRCPLCNKNARRTLRWFTTNGKTAFCLSSCQEHGDVAGKIRFRKTEEEQFFVVKTLWIPTEEETEEIRTKRALLSKKKPNGKDL